MSAPTSTEVIYAEITDKNGHLKNLCKFRSAIACISKIYGRNAIIDLANKFDVVYPMLAKDGIYDTADRYLDILREYF